MKAFITGGGGFIGSAIACELVRRGFSVTSFSRNDYPALGEKGIEVMKGDISDADSVSRACEQADIIFHVAAKAGTAGHYRDYYRTNVTGTANIIQACKKNKIKYLIYTSSASVVFNGKNIEGADESLPYPSRPLSYYTATKAIAEQMILQANSPVLGTISLRPHLVYGPGDNHLIPEIISKAVNGRLYRIGKCRNLVDVTYIDNVVTAHINAAQAVIINPEVTGKAYFITNGEPVRLWDFLDMILQVYGLVPLKKRIPVWSAMMISHVSEIFHRIFTNDQETLTPFIVSELTRSHWFDISRARRLLDYEPVITNTEGLKRMMICLQS